MTKILLIIAAHLLASTYSFSLESRVFVSTPVSTYPKKLVQECMSVPFALSPDDSVDEAISKLIKIGRSSSPVCDTNGSLVGIVSSFDFLQKEAFEGALLTLDGQQSKSYADAAKKICAQKISDIMTPNPVSISPGMTMQAAATLMNKEKVHRLPVVDDEGTLVGLVTSSDVMMGLLHNHENLPPANGENHPVP